MYNRSFIARRMFIKIFNWEYWPFHLVYGSIYVYWLWLCLKARSFFFFNTANPLIKNGGFLMESKKGIYDLLPAAYYPATILCKPATSYGTITKELAIKNLSLPLIAKPDIGMRGLQVKLLETEHDIRQYLESSKVDFLLQEYIAYEQEVGIFYYRFPGSATGHISGIVGKEFLTVIGDGWSTIEELLVRNDRFLLQLPLLRTIHGKVLQQVLNKGEVHTLVPYGNHSRGAKFIDLTHLITEQLLQTINRVCTQIPEFYFGRLDIKYNTWDEFCKGEDFCIIEINGAGSEPTHMYDPSHNLLYAWKEIIRHWRLLYEISMLNKKAKGLSYLTIEEGMRMLKDNKRQLQLISC